MNSLIFKNMNMSKYLLITLFLFGFNALFSQETSLFLKDDVNVSHLEKDQFSKNAFNKKSVTINFNSLNQKNIEIPLFGERVIAQFKNHYKSAMGAETWTGDLKYQKNGYAIFTKNKDTFFGKILTESGVAYIIKQIENTDYYSVSELSADTFNDHCNITLQGKENRPLNNETEIDNVCDTEQTCDQTNIDLIVFYTNDAMSDLGGKASIEAAIASAVSEINVINANSNVKHTVTLVYTALTNLTEKSNQDLSGIMSMMKDPNDGVMDEIPMLRDQYYADLVALITLKGASGGTGNVNTNPERFNPQSAYSISKLNTMLSQYTLAHEIGHNLGLRHDRYAYNGSDLPNAACDYGWGWVNPNASAGNRNSQWRTIMAYNNQCSDNGLNCVRIPYFSNPDLSYNGDALGAAIGTNNAANNASILNRSYCKVAEFRSPQCSDCKITYNGGCVDYNSNSATGPGNTTNIEFTQTMLPVEIGHSVTLYLTYAGDNKNSSEQFNILDENDTIIGETVPLNSDCDSNTIEINIPVSDFNNWIADGKVIIKLDPQTTRINPTYCSLGNNVCVEFGISSKPLDVIDVETHETISMYPNPTNGSFEIKSNIEFSMVKVYNNLGLFLFETRDKKITLKNYPSGLYFIKATSIDNKTFNAKIIKK